MFESLVILILQLFGQTQEGLNTTVPSELVFQEAKIETPTEVESIRGEDSPLSMKTFLNQEFAGTNFQLGNRLQDWGTHESFYATYVSNGFKVSGTWHLPKGEGPFPLLILNHGYFPPESYTNGYGFGREQKFFARNGYAVFHIDYRGYAFSDKDPLAYTGQRFGYTGYGADAINAILAVQEANIEKVDTSRVGMFGHSLGGGVTLNAVLARPDLIDVGVLWGPVSSNYYDNFKKWTEKRMSEEGRLVFEQNFGSVNDPESFKAVSARTYLDQLSVPIYIQQGTEDEDCPVSWARETEQILTNLGKDFKYTEYDGFPHVFWNQNWDRAVNDALVYLDADLKK